MEITDISLGIGAIGEVKKVKIGNKLYAIKKFIIKGVSKEYKIHKMLDH